MHGVQILGGGIGFKALHGDLNVYSACGNNIMYIYLLGRIHVLLRTYYIFYYHKVDFCQGLETFRSVLS